jgi:hypothetical protein
MNLRVKAAALSLVTLATLAGGVAAFADDEDHPLPGATAPAAGTLPKPHHPHPEENELHDRYGNDIGQVNLPPLVVKEDTKTSSSGVGGAKPFTGTSTKSSTTTSTTEKLVNADNTNPVANLPVDPTTINPNEGTPAETFFNAATFGLGAMGLGVVALGGVAVTRAIRLISSISSPNSRG